MFILLSTQHQHFDILSWFHLWEASMYSRNFVTFSITDSKSQILFLLPVSHSTKRWREHLCSFTSSSILFSCEAYLLGVLTALPVAHIMMRSDSKWWCLLGDKEAITTNLTLGCKNNTPACAKLTYGKEKEWSRAVIQSPSSKLSYLGWNYKSNFFTALHRHLPHCQTYK